MQTNQTVDLYIGAFKLVGVKRRATESLAGIVNEPILAETLSLAPPVKRMCSGLLSQGQLTANKSTCYDSPKSMASNHNTTSLPGASPTSKTKLELKSMVKTHRWPINKDIKVEYDFLELIYKPQIFSYTFVSSKKVGNQVTS